MLARLVVADLKIILRNRQALFWALAFPIMFATIFGLFNFDNIGEAQIAVLSRDGSPAAATFTEAVRKTEVLKLETSFETESAARAALLDGDLDFVLLATGDSVELLFDETEADRNAVFLPLVRQIIDETNLRVAGITPQYRLQIIGVAGKAVEYYDFVLPGLVGMAVMTYGIIGLSSTIAQYRGQRILRRIRATPLKPRTFIGGIVIAHLLLSLVQSALVLAWGVLLFDGTVRGSLLSIALFVLLGNLTFLNIGFMVASRAQSAEAASGLGNAVTMPMMFFSGVFFPSASLPWILPTLTAMLPLHPLVDAIREISVDGASITSLGPQIGKLAAWAAVTFVLATRVFRFERA